MEPNNNPIPTPAPQPGPASQPAPAQQPQPMLSQTPSKGSNDAQIWIAVGLVAISAIIDIVTMFTGNYLALNIVMFFASAIAVVLALIAGKQKTNKWSDWRIVAVVVLGGFLALTTAIGQVNSWVTQARVNDLNTKTIKKLETMNNNIDF